MFPHFREVGSSQTIISLCVSWLSWGWNLPSHFISLCFRCFLCNNSVTTCRKLIVNQISTDITSTNNNWATGGSKPPDLYWYYFNQYSSTTGSKLVVHHQNVKQKEKTATRSLLILIQLLVISSNAQWRSTWPGSYVCCFGRSGLIIFFASRWCSTVVYLQLQLLSVFFCVCWSSWKPRGSEEPRIECQAGVAAPFIHNMR